ncbi:thiamine/thiamine pyrophosphate ABC transporter permease [Marinobacter bryozoorum]|uniref:thiamine/thiamine pyrophosphate ABC transporter permease n=1 Tax=Marinobacter bryozoorum TaxID=256324 RepID=UPI00200689A4|nr:thiamine/thiamine pyrophosphate ABC transporter permease [Marinobacter bryozoorum]MCK7545759.1 thiamine/thiamine pyrophosphate ABC transporter permease [Marinobacter bryozoorum]
MTALTRPAPPFSRRRWQLAPGLVFTSLVLVLMGGGLLALILRADSGPSELWQSPYLQGVIRFTAWQASLSVIGSLLIAIPIARALVRQPDLPGRAGLLRLMEMSLVMPTIVAVSGLVAVYGRRGWLAEVTEWAGGSLPWNLYGISGILLAHIFFNAPLAARVMVQTLERVPVSQRRAASQLGLGSWQLWRVLDWPALRPVMPGLAALVFSLCFTSFAIVVTLGGGPGATTIEVAIYQALRFEFDFNRAALLAFVQLLICGGLWWLVFRKNRHQAVLPDQSSSTDTGSLRADSAGWRRTTDRALIGLFALFLALPVLAIALRGVPWLARELTNPRLALWDATFRSLAIALPAGLLAVAITLALLAATSALKPGLPRSLASVSGYLPLIVPPIVLGTGLFLLIQPRLGIQGYGLTVVALINSLMALPFTLQVLRGPFQAMGTPALRVADQLDIRGWYRWRWLQWPRLKRPLALALGYGITLSLGDFGVIALFGSPAQPTLPMLLHQQLGSYQVAAATGTACWLLIFIAALFTLLSRPGRVASRSAMRDTGVTHTGVPHA